MLVPIQKTIKNYLEAVDLTDITYGVVTSISPLKIKIDQKLELPEQVLLLTSSVVRKEIDLKHVHEYEDSTIDGSSNKQTKEAFNEKIVITEGLEVKDKVMLLKVNNGQKYVVLDKLQAGD
ncbi:DUF2577 domain-containing protein [Abyssisolibacter fermentans]|uniref:DUF2577 domain-containing protein n=1 Tax=Abyssisolibacter fermentans TaxID=1766203 RepID=UPI00082A3AF4|nr:DUF2577 domain-containing protein [Abyssisolibacter fermentans]